jgi:RNA polymerase sigma-70 factor (ECF subfamily)
MRERLARSGLHDRSQVDDPDRALVIRAQAGNREAFEELVRRHADRLYAVVLRFGLPSDAAQEVTQEAFLRAWRGIGSFRGDARFLTWLYRIGLNEARRRMRREALRPFARSLDDAHALEPRDVREEPYARVAHAELREALAAAVRALPAKYRAPLILRDIEGLSTVDAAEVLGVGEAALKSRLHRARAAVRSGVEDRLGREV